MDKAKLISDKNDQSVRLPKAYRLKGKEVFITKVGNAIILLPKEEKWNLLFNSLDKFSDDFMNERLQPDMENREEIFQ